MSPVMVLPKKDRHFRGFAESGKYQDYVLTTALSYVNVYLSGDIFHLTEWHDSFIVDQVREGTDVSARNLTAEIKTEGPANIFDMSFLGEYAHHLKGQLKFNGK